MYYTYVPNNNVHLINKQTNNLSNKKQQTNLPKKAYQRTQLAKQ